MSIAYNSSIVRDGLVLNLDAGNVKSYSVNVHPYPTDIGRWTTSGSNATLTRDTSVTDSPVKGIPLKMAITGNDPYTLTYNNSIWNLAPAVSGQTWTASVYVKASAVTEGTIFLFEANSSGSYTALSTNVVPITTTWTRISVTRTFDNGTTAYVQVRLDGPDSGGSGINIWWDGLQVERSVTASDFTSRTNTNGNTWADLSSSVTNGTLINYPTFNSSNSGYLSFNGTNHYADMGNILASLTSLSLEAVVYFTTQSTNYNGIISKTSGNTDGYELRTTTYSSTTTNIEFRYKGDNASSGGFTCNNSTWYHIVGTGDLGRQRLYVNNSLVASNTVSTTPGVTANNLVIGKLGYAGLYMAGRIAIAKVYNKELSSTEVAQNFESIKGRYGI